MSSLELPSLSAADQLEIEAEVGAATSEPEPLHPDEYLRRCMSEFFGRRYHRRTIMGRLAAFESFIKAKIGREDEYEEWHH